MSKTILSSSIKWVLVFAALLFLSSFYFLSGVYATFLMSFVVSYLVNPVVIKLSKKGIPRKYAILLVLLVLFSSMILIAMAVAPKVFIQAKDLAVRIPVLFSSVMQKLAAISERHLGYNAFMDVESWLSFTKGDGTTPAEASFLINPVGGLLQGFFKGSFKVVTFLLGLFVVPLVSFYLLVEFPHLKKDFLSALPHRYHHFFEELIKRLNHVFGGYLRGQLVVSSILSLYYCTAFMILRIDLALVLGLMAGFFNVVPYVGIASVIVLTFLIVLIHSVAVGKFIALAIVFVLGMAVEGSVLTPRIVGKKVGIGPLTLILSLLAGGELLGLVGMLLAIPFVAVCKVVFVLIFESLKTTELYK